MQISIMSVSIPLDTDTIDEITELLHEAFLEDEVNYSSLLGIDELSNYYVKGFCVLAYDDKSDKLVGVLSAMDRIATLDFEWSAVVLPSARRQGIGEQLVKELVRNLELREAETDLALIAESAQAGKQLLQKHGYVYDFSERTMITDAAENELFDKIEIKPFQTEVSELKEVLMTAFQDTEDETMEFIGFNTQTPNRRLMLAMKENRVVGTVTIVDETDKLWVTGLAVHPHAQGRGIATALLNWSKNEAYLLGKSAVCLDVETDNQNALNVYKKAGFQTISHTNFYRKSAIQ